MNNFICEQCGEIDHIVFDGYGFGDRLMEGVEFTLSSNGEVEAKGGWDNSNYLKQFNKEIWLTRAKSHISGYDIGYCPKCGEDIYSEEGFEAK